MYKVFFILTFGLYSACVSSAPRTCAENIDNLQLFYINGMFTDYNDFQSNIKSIDRFQAAHLIEFAANNLTRASHNKAEQLFEQFYQVLMQKLQSVKEAKEYEDIYASLLNGNLLSMYAASEELKIKQYAELITALTGYDIVDEIDYQRAYAELESVLGTCSRVVLVTHSQGNFYGDQLISDFYYSYSFPGGWELASYPMLGQMAIATPSSRIGGSYSANIADLLGNITNSNDLYMLAVRVFFGSVPATFLATINEFDSSGHSLVESYLEAPEQSLVISSEVNRIANAMMPLPTFNQLDVDSSAFDSIGVSHRSSILDVEFNSGSVYRYYYVPTAYLDGILDADSVGGYYNDFIKGNYLVEQIELPYY